MSTSSEQLCMSHISSDHAFGALQSFATCNRATAGLHLSRKAQCYLSCVIASPQSQRSRLVQKCYCSYAWCELPLVYLLVSLLAVGFCASCSLASACPCVAENRDLVIDVSVRVCVCVCAYMPHSIKAAEIM